MIGRRLTLRTAFGVIAAIAIACGAMKSADTWVPILFGAAMLLVIAMAITALVDRGSRQAFAIGLVVATSIYATTVVLAIVLIRSPSGTPWVELDPFEGELPTTRVLASVFVRIVQYLPSTASTTQFGGGGPVTLEVPGRENFMLVGHLLWALLFGYFGGCFGRLVYARRT